MFHTYGELAARKMTGRTRVRVGWFGKLILQVEIESPNPQYPRPPRPSPCDPWANGSYRFWTDATVAHVQELAPAALLVWQNEKASP